MRKLLSCNPFFIKQDQRNLQRIICSRRRDSVSLSCSKINEQCNFCQIQMKISWQAFNFGNLETNFCFILELVNTNNRFCPIFIFSICSRLSHHSKFFLTFFFQKKVIGLKSGKMLQNFTSLLLKLILPLSEWKIGIIRRAQFVVCRTFIFLDHFPFSTKLFNL